MGPCIVKADSSSGSEPRFCAIKISHDKEMELQKLQFPKFNDILGPHKPGPRVVSIWFGPIHLPMQCTLVYLDLRLSNIYLGFISPCCYIITKQYLCYKAKSEIYF
jgi:hypothetical protein